MHALIAQEFNESIAVKSHSLTVLAPLIEKTATLIIECLRAKGKVMVCGNGGSAADAQHFAAELVNRFELERHPLAGLALTTDSSVLTSIANDYDYSQIFSKQIMALGDDRDCLVVISTSGNAPSVIEAVNVALEKSIQVIVLSGKDGGQLATRQHPLLTELRVPFGKTSRIQEVHLLVIHIWCKMIDLALAE